MGGLFGIGGAMLAIPVLGLVFGMSEQLAQGTALVMALPNVIIGLLRYRQKAGLDLRMAGFLAGIALPVTFLCARVATALPSRPLRIGFALFLLVVAVDIGRRALRTDAPASTIRLPWPFVGVVGAISGVFSGFFGIGGAIVTVPAMTILFGYSQLAAQGMSLAFSAPTSLLTVLTYASAGDVDWAVSIPLAIGGVAFVSRGVDLAHRLPERILRLLFVGFVVIVSVALLIKARV
jgi:uncharacterized membrane protein YfcA